GITVSGSAGGALTFTSAKGEKIDVQVTGDTANSLGFGTFLKGSGNSADYTSLTAGAAYSSATAFGTAKLEYSINGGASAGNILSIDLNAGDATAAAKAATADSDQSTKTLTFSLDGAATQTVTLGATDDTAIEAAAAINANPGASAIVTASVNS